MRHDTPSAGRDRKGFGLVGPAPAPAPSRRPPPPNRPAGPAVLMLDFMGSQRTFFVDAYGRHTRVGAGADVGVSWAAQKTPSTADMPSIGIAKVSRRRRPKSSIKAGGWAPGRQAPGRRALAAEPSRALPRPIRPRASPMASRTRSADRGTARRRTPRGPARPAPDQRPEASSSSATTGLTAVCQTTAWEPYSRIDQALSTTW